VSNIPSDPRDMLRLYRDVREKRLLMQKQVDAVSKFEGELKNALIDAIPKSGDGIVADGYSAVVTTKTKPTVKDWAAFHEYVANTGRFDMLQKRLADAAVTDTEGWESLPGMGTFNVVDLSVTKV